MFCLHSTRKCCRVNTWSFRLPSPAVEKLLSVETKLALKAETPQSNICGFFRGFIVGCLGFFSVFFVCLFCYRFSCVVSADSDMQAFSCVKNSQPLTQCRNTTKQFTRMSRFLTREFGHCERQFTDFSLIAQSPWEHTLRGCERKLADSWLSI